MLFQRPKDPFRSSTTSTQLGLKTFSRLSMPMAPILALDTSRLEKPLSASKTRSARLLAWHQSKEAVDEGLAEVLVEEGQSQFVAVAVEGVGSVLLPVLSPKIRNLLVHLVVF